MISSTQIKIVIALAVVVWGVLLFLQGVSLKFDYLRPYSLVVGVVIVAVTIYELFLWRWWPVSLVSRRPILRGTWKGHLKSTWVDPETGTLRDSIPVYLVVRQTASTVTLRLLTSESRSVSSSASIVDQGGIHQLASTYQAVPRLLLRKGSPIHHGCLVFEIGSRYPRKLDGSYWTDRDTKGELVMAGHSPSIHPDFDAADEGKYAAGVKARLGPFKLQS